MTDRSRIPEASLNWPLNGPPPSAEPVELVDSQLTRAYYLPDDYFFPEGIPGLSADSVEKLHPDDGRKIVRFVASRDRLLNAAGAALHTAEDPLAAKISLGALTSRKNMQGLPAIASLADEGLVAENVPAALLPYDIEQLALGGIVAFMARMPNKNDFAAGLYAYRMEVARYGDEQQPLIHTDNFIRQAYLAGSWSGYRRIADSIRAALGQPRSKNYATVRQEISASRHVHENDLPGVSFSTLQGYQEAEPLIANAAVDIESKNLEPKGLDIFSQVISLAASIKPSDGRTNFAEIINARLKQIAELAAPEITTPEIKTKLRINMINLANGLSQSSSGSDSRTIFRGADKLDKEDKFALPKAMDRILYGAFAHLDDRHIAGLSSTGHCARMLVMLGIDSAKQSQEVWPANSREDWRIRYGRMPQTEREKLVDNAENQGQLDALQQLKVHTRDYLGKINAGDKPE